MDIIKILKTLYRRLPAPPSSNYMFKKVKPNPYELLPKNPTIIDIGAKTSRGVYAFGRPPENATFLALDIEPGPGVDIVADAHDLSIIEENSIDCVITVSTLEHVRRPWKVVDEVRRILKPGGIFYVSVPFIFPFHADPSDYYRFSSEGIAVLCEGFEKVDGGFNRGPASTFHEVAIRFFAIFFSFNSGRVYGFNVKVFKWLLFWVKYMDYFLGHHPDARVVHTGSFFLGRKPDAS